MANVVEKFGLRPYKNLNGASWNNAQNRYTITNNYGTAIFQGDMVIPVTAGNEGSPPALHSTAPIGNVPPPVAAFAILCKRPCKSLP